MRIPIIHGVIQRRVLVNYRVDADVAARLLPVPFRPKLAKGYAMAGICLIGLRHIRPAFLPMSPGFGSENAAHRFAVEWERGGQRQEGVFIPRRDTSSRMNAFLGGWLFPGEHHRARFDITDGKGRLRVRFESDDGTAGADVRARLAGELPAESIFDSVQEASRFFEAGSLGYSATPDPGRYDGLELKCKTWSVQPLAVESVRSSFFDDRTRFPQGSATFDSALLMRDIEHEWHAREDLCCGER